MAGAAIVRQAKLHMRRIVAVYKVICMAGVTGRRSPFEYIVDVTCCARQRRVSPSQCVAGLFQMVKLGVEPGVHRVAALAGGWKAGRDMVEHGG